MEKLTIILDWIGALFLSLEAIKLHNFIAITGKLKRLRIAINPPFHYQKDGTVLIPHASKGYKIIRRLSSIIQIVFGYLCIFLVVALINKSDFVVHCIKTFFGSLYKNTFLIFSGKLILGVMIFFALPFYIGLLMTSFFSKFSDNFEEFLSNFRLPDLSHISLSLIYKST